MGGSIVCRDSPASMHDTRSRTRAGQPTPRLQVRVDPAVVGRSTEEIIAALWDLDPRVAVLPGRGEEFFMTPDTLGEGESDIVVESVVRVLANGRDHAAASVPSQTDRP